MRGIIVGINLSARLDAVGPRGRECLPEGLVVDPEFELDFLHGRPDYAEVKNSCGL